MMKEENHTDWEIIFFTSLTVIVIISLFILLTRSKGSNTGISGYLQTLPSVGA